MKLHRIAVHNLNSLYDEQVVDLERDLEGASLFLIQGPTGSGKSTLMDAVSLALFGTTPRLRGVRKASDMASAILSHGAGSGFAEVVFSRWHAGDGPLSGRVTYRARWAVRRARDKADGKVQDPHRSLDRLQPGVALDEAGRDDWQILTSDSREKFFAPVFDEHLAGFSVHDFQRSMLLAQGQFDAMLRADPKERASILERLTNTDIYEVLGNRAAKVREHVTRHISALTAEVNRLSGDGEGVSREALEAQATEARAKADAHRERCDAVRAVLRIEDDLVGVAEKRERDLKQRPQIEAAVKQAAERAEFAHVHCDTVVQATGALREPMAEVRERLEAGRAMRRARDQAQADLKTARDRVVERAAQVAKLEAGVGGAVGELVRQVRGADAEVRAELAALGFDAQGPDLAAAVLGGEVADVLADVQARVEQLVQQDRAFEGQLTRLREAAPLRQRRDEDQAKLAQLEEEQAALPPKLADAAARLEETAARLESAQQARKSVERVLQHEEARAALVPGEACPLCGSEHHPLRDAARDESLAELDRTTREGLEAATKAHADATERHQRLRLDEEHLEKRIAEQTGAVERARVAFEACIDALHAQFGDEIPGLEAIEAERERGAAVGKVLTAVGRTLQQIDRSTSDLATQQAELARERGQVVECERVEARAQADLEQGRSEIEQHWGRLREFWAAAAALDGGGAEGGGGGRGGGCDGWEPDVGGAHIREPGGPESHVREPDDRPSDPQAAAGSRPPFPEFGSVDSARLRALEQHQAEVENEARRRQQEQEQAAAQLRQELGELESRLKVHEEDHEKLVAARGPAAAEVRRQFADAGLEIDVQIDVQPDALRQMVPLLDDEARQLDDARVAAEGALRAAQQRATELEHAQRRLGAARERGRLWLELHDLIGVAEGQRFKQFAQALNLGQLLERANRHLSRLNDRYRLIPVRDPETGLPTLEFEIADGWRPGSTRSIQTLSGGEGFLVSLALALGLSDLRTGSMPIETLLLDEGFGTLDRDTLDVALAALQQLQADGRQIGIISHVAGLEDRIDARIRVEPLGNGRSRVRAGVGG